MLEQFKKQIDNEMKGCGEPAHAQEGDDGFTDLIGCGERRVRLKDNKEVILFCPTCKTRIKTYLTTMIKCYEEEIKRRIATNHDVQELKKGKINGYQLLILSRWQEDNREEIEELKQKINYLKEKLEEVK